ncbi:MAG: bifunctional hydroxymethylpyrimidine kinase/phosphomethylpyrimidine kinase [Butyrivibrio sp.]|uniref:bifunctional hydroxymethylpyrimidine kinase/phosphomethylpyrimidine kinase n=1 Tax=Butyrivibrio sp. TaxID=28121 RepID=UPI0025B94568|nr:bifunctional hydroxymethylpyrimidine kinase/phosphomethylpyrimidine kinase [Butyrivibrio sp.]MBQ6588643.1 bifunctional hydroxymethylpyrimidine kinase/phosphomethylpyrimidine kinase [Butyrivibrio sp.]
MKQKTVLTIAGSDSSGGAGIQADLKTMEAHGVYGMSVITALTAQNTMGITGVMPVDKSFVHRQLEAVCEDIMPDAVKIGMLPDKEVMEAVAETIDKYKLRNIVLDPVLSSTSGTELTRSEAMKYMSEQLFCRCDLITPNIPEAEKLLALKSEESDGTVGSSDQINSRDEMEESAIELSSRYKCSVLIKGGHSSFDREGVSSDLLCIRGNEGNGEQPEYKLIWLEGSRIDNPNTHGTGCTLSSAIAANQAGGYDLETSVRRAKEYIEKCISAGLDLGQGRGPLCHRV